MSRRKLIVVGAGMTGLCTGVFALKEGFDVTILERSSKIGGVSTSWERGGYVFEGGMHWLVGSADVMQPMNRYWKEVGALKANNPVSVKDPVITLMRGGAPRIHLWRDIGRLKMEWIEYAPEDECLIRLFCADLKLMQLFQKLGSGGWRNILKLILLSIPFVARMAVWYSSSTESYSARFRNNDIRALLSHVICSGHNALSLIYTVASYCMGDSGYPEGGSTRMASNMAETFTEGGGVIRYGAQVERIIVEDGCAKGVICNGSRIDADEIVVTSDTLKAVEQFFDFPLKEKWISGMRSNFKPLACMFVGLGIEADLSAYSYSLRLSTDKPVKAGGLEYDCLQLFNYASVKDNSPEGCTTVTVLLYGDTYDYWLVRKMDGTYEREKEETVSRIIAAVEEQIPESRGRVRISNMATPLTYERYSDVTRGAWMSVWKEGVLPPLMPKCKSIRHLRFAGQRTMLSGGLPIALQTGRAAAKAASREV